LAVRGLSEPRKVLAMSAALPPDLVDRLVKIIMMFSSPYEGDIINAGRALQRQLASAHTDIHALAAHLKAGGGLSDEDKKQIRAEIINARAAGYAEGVRDGEARAHGVDDFRNTDGSIDWRQVALFVERDKHRLPARAQSEKSREFIEDMAMRAKSPFSRGPTQRQHEWLHDLFFKLGGKIT
jgi:hypothetical protein